MPLTTGRPLTAAKDSSSFRRRASWWWRAIEPVLGPASPFLGGRPDRSWAVGRRHLDYGQTVSLAPVDDPAVATWIGETTDFRSGRVDGLVPRGFQSYVRVLHPAKRLNPPGYVHWAQIADQLGTTIDAESQLEELLGLDDLSNKCAFWDVAPTRGGLDNVLRRAIASVLARETDSESSILFAVWEGYAGLPMLVEGAPIQEIWPHTRFHLLSGTLRDYIAWPARHDRLSPDMVWPTDRSWFIRSDTDLASSYIGCSSLAAAELGKTETIELVHVSPQTSIIRRQD
jgi:hypothetical protein